MNTQLKHRIKSYAWRFAGMTIVALAGFIINAGSIFNVDWVAFVDFGVLYSLGLLVGEITKFLNQE